MEFQEKLIMRFTDLRNRRIDTPINIPISKKPLVANLGVFHISHKCQGLENSTLYSKNNFEFIVCPEMFCIINQQDQQL